MGRPARALISGSCSRNPYYSKPSHSNPPRFELPATRIIREAQTGVITKPLHTGIRQGLSFLQQESDAKLKPA